ncbi:MAG: hypothetical protein ACI959_000389 [Limisphaerales bacterium]|jgi:hypothetical protein
MQLSNVLSIQESMNKWKVFLRRYLSMREPVTYVILLVFISAVWLIGLACKPATSAIPPTAFENKSMIDGVAFTAPDREIPSQKIATVKQTGADWICILPYGFCYRDKPEVRFDSKNQWWGERTEGVIKQIEHAQTHDLKVLLKPHIWVIGQGWLGDFELSTEADWQKWEDGYTTYILRYAHIADSMDVALFCIGTEAKRIIAHRPDYMPELIKKIKNIYDGKLTYAANWDNYKQIKFWDQLDYIGIDAYFPLTNQKAPTVEQLQQAWQPHYNEIKSFALDADRPIIFTEFGYMSVEGTAWKNWEIESSLKTQQISMVEQENAFEAFFKTFWHEDWFAGGFIWKWYAWDNSGGISDKDYTPQGKPVMATIQKYYR